jgi:hypothetical protein
MLNLCGIVAAILKMGRLSVAGLGDFIIVRL